MNRIPDAYPDDSRDRGGLDLRELFMHGVRRSFGWVCLLVVLGAVVGIVAGLMRPNQYVSNAKLLLRLGAREMLTSESLADVDEQQPQDSRPTMADEMEMLSDVALFERVVRELGPRAILEPANPRRDDGPETPWRTRLLHSAQASLFGSSAPSHDCDGAACETCVRAATKVLVEDTKVVNEGGSNVVRITHTSTSPEKAQLVVQTLAETFIERHRDQFSLQPLVEKSRGRLEQIKADRDEATNAYFAHVEACGFIELETQSKALLTEIDLLESDLFAARARRAEIERQRAALEGRLDKDTPASVTVVHPAVLVPNEERETQLQLKRSLLQQQASLSAENRPIDEMRRLKKKYDDQIAKVDELLRTLPKAVPQSTERRENMGPSALAIRLEDLGVEDSALDVKAQLLQERLAEKQTRAKQLHTCEKEHAALISTRDGLEAKFQRLSGLFSVFQALANVDKEDANLRLLQSPTMEREKIGPKRFSLLLKGLLGGLILGVSFAMLRQRFDQRTLDPDAFARACGVPVLGLIPDHPELHRRSAHAR